MTEIPELTPDQFQRAIPATVRRRLMAGHIESGADGLVPTRLSWASPAPAGLTWNAGKGIGGSVRIRGGQRSGRHKEMDTRMRSVTLRAHYDGERIVRDEPFELPVNAPLTVTVLGPPSSELDRDRESWVVLSAQSLARAYGEDEPEYTVADLRP